MAESSFWKLLRCQEVFLTIQNGLISRSMLWFSSQKIAGTELRNISHKPIIRNIWTQSCISVHQAAFGSLNWGPPFKVQACSVSLVRRHSAPFRCENWVKNIESRLQWLEPICSDRASPWSVRFIPEEFWDKANFLQPRPRMWTYFPRILSAVCWMRASCGRTRSMGKSSMKISSYDLFGWLIMSP